MSSGEESPSSFDTELRMRSPRHEQLTPRLYVIPRPTRTEFSEESGLSCWVFGKYKFSLVKLYTYNSAPTWVVSLLERLETTEDGSALVTDPTTISLVESDEVPLL